MVVRQIHLSMVMVFVAIGFDMFDIIGVAICIGNWWHHWSMVFVHEMGRINRRKRR